MCERALACVLACVHMYVHGCMRVRACALASVYVQRWAELPEWLTDRYTQPFCLVSKIEM